MAEWEHQHRRGRSRDPDNHFLAPENLSRRPLSIRAPRSRDGLDEVRRRRPSLHRDYYSDNQAMMGERRAYNDDDDDDDDYVSIYSTTNRAPSPRRLRYSEQYSEQGYPLPSSYAYNKQVPSPPPSIWHVENQDPSDELHVAVEPAREIYQAELVRLEDNDKKRLDWARQEQDRLIASHSQPANNITGRVGSREAKRRMPIDSDPRRISPSRTPGGHKIPIVHPPTSHSHLPSRPRRNNRSPSPRRQYWGPSDTTGFQSRGVKTPRNEEDPSSSIPGAFPSDPGAILSDDTRSEILPSHQRWHHLPKVTHRSTQSLTSSSGILGDKVYRYSPLKGSEFRLISILPARMTTIKCEMLHFSLQSPPAYRAISYAWGDAGHTRKIMLDGTSISIAVSLYGALEALREKKNAVLVWADFLCIDQQNRDEKTQQLQLMTNIYSKAESVAIWLGPEADHSDLAVKLLEEVAANSKYPERVTSLIRSRIGEPDFAAVVSLFERAYWRRLWVVQEVLNAKDIWVYCGAVLHWTVYKAASHVFWRHKNDLDDYFPAASKHKRGQQPSTNQFTISQTLVYQGPGSLPELAALTRLGEESLLHVMRALRRKVSSDPRDKVFGILGVLPPEIRSEFPVDLSLSVKEVYINVVDYLLSTTERLDVICESIHFPLHTSSAELPTWAPDWSHSPETNALGSLFDFSAAGSTKVDYRFIDERRNKLEIAAIYVDTIETHGIAVGTLCTLADYLMGFLQWRALVLDSVVDDESSLALAEADFCRILCLDQIPPEWDDYSWRMACYHVFASLLSERLPRLQLDRDLYMYLDAKVDIKPQERRSFLQKHFGSRMMGRSFLITKESLMGIGSGFMTAGDVIVVPLGCSTPVILRPEGSRGGWRFVGDVLIDGYMHGEAVKEWKSGDRALGKYVLH